MGGLGVFRALFHQLERRFFILGSVRRSDSIKYGANIFNICSLVDLPSAYTDIDLGFSTWSLIVIELIKRPLRCDRILSIDIYDPQISFSLCWNFNLNQLSFQEEVTQFHM